jgi:hypothetical protein
VLNCKPNHQPNKKKKYNTTNYKNIKLYNQFKETIYGCHIPATPIIGNRQNGKIGKKINFREFS